METRGIELMYTTTSSMVYRSHIKTDGSESNTNFVFDSLDRNEIYESEVLAGINFIDRLGPWVTSSQNLSYSSIATIPSRISGVSTSIREESYEESLIQSSIERLRKNRERIEYLRLLGGEDDITINEKSEQDFWKFSLYNLNILVKDIVLGDTGNLGVSWSDSKRSLLALHFLGEEVIRFVIFKHRRKSQPRTEVSGDDTFEGILSLIEEFDLYPLIAA